MRGGEQCAKGFDVQAMPTSYLIDKHGVIRYIHQGFREGEMEEQRHVFWCCFFNLILPSYIKFKCVISRIVCHITHF